MIDMNKGKEQNSWLPNEVFARLAGQLSPRGLVRSGQYAGDVRPWKEPWRALLDFVPAEDTCNFRVDSILESARAGQWPLFVLQVGLWGQMIPGTMGRSFKKIYGVGYGEDPGLDQLHTIEKALGNAQADLERGAPLEGVWNTLRRELGWSAVMISKCLHFMARAAGREDPLPVPVDNAMVRRWLWPSFKKSAVGHGFSWPRPGGLAGDDWEVYNRYLTVVQVWAADAGWNCMDIETALFARWRSDSDTLLDFVKNQKFR
jgi:hypothetical protein